MNKENRGGSRSGAGRKPVTDKKIQVAFYIEESAVALAGGLEESRQVAAAAVRRRAKKTI